MQGNGNGQSARFVFWDLPGSSYRPKDRKAIFKYLNESPELNRFQMSAVKSVDHSKASSFASFLERLGARVTVIEGKEV